jgi:transcriptional regulator with PAS, ATPase and Fis domain
MDTIQAIKQRFEIIGNEPKLNRAIEKSHSSCPTDISVWLWVRVVSEKSIPKSYIRFLIETWKYIAVNCGAIPEGTIDSELLGMKRRFTGATGTREGYFEVANGGTIF